MLQYDIARNVVKIPKYGTIWLRIKLYLYRLIIIQWNFQ